MSRLGRAAVLTVVALVAAACIPRDTSQIVLDEERTITDFGQTWELDYYVNDAYECGLSGHYSFMVMNPGGDPDAEAPLWVYLHGGGQGYWDENGDYQTLTFLNENSWNHQETFDGLINGLQARVLDRTTGQPEDQTLVRRIQEGYRLLVVGYCDHDFYSGLGTPYPNHPTNPDAEVNGLQATMAAIDFTAANYPTTQVWAHGTSAGSVGVWSLASSYGFEGTPVTGIVADSGAVAPGLFDVFDEYLASGDLNLMPTWEPAGLTAKVGFFANEAIPAYPEAQIQNDFRAVPSLFIIGSVDPFCAGQLAPVPEAAPGLTNCEHAYSGLDQSIAGQVDSPHGFHFLAGTGHVPTNDPGPANDIVDAFITEVLATNPPDFASE